MYELILSNEKGELTTLLYDPHKSTITNLNGSPAIEKLEPKNWTPIHAVSPETPGSKNAEGITRLKIQLGLQCNYSCSYCLQRAQVADAARTSTHDARMFLFHLDKWLKSKPQRIEFWGGEPLLYWNKIKILHEALKDKFHEATFLMITNGSLLRDDIIDYIIENKFMIAISHDGPGQHLRGPDPLDDKRSYTQIRRLIDNHSPVSLNAVLTPDNYDPDDIKKFFVDRLGSKVQVNFEGVVVDYEDGKGRLFTQAQYEDLARKIAIVCSRPVDQIPHAFRSKMQSFFNSLTYQRPSWALAQKCGMDKDDSIAVDLTGNVMTCQNVGSKEHKIGHVFDMQNVKLNTSWHWSKRDECSGCPLLQLCAGSCMYVEGKSWFYSCNNEYYYNLGILAGALAHMFGLTLMEVRGEIRRPDPADYGVTAIL